MASSWGDGTGERRSAKRGKVEEEWTEKCWRGGGKQRERVENASDFLQTGIITFPDAGWDGWLSDGLEKGIRVDKGREGQASDFLQAGFLTFKGGGQVAGG